MNAHRGQLVFGTDAVPIGTSSGLVGSGVANLQVRVWSYVGGARVRRWGMAEPMLPGDALPVAASAEQEKHFEVFLRTP